MTKNKCLTLERKKVNSRRWYLRNRDKPEYKERAKINRERYKEKKKKYDKKNYWKIKESHIKRLYGIDLVEYNKLLKENNGVCWICLKSETKRSRSNNKIMSLIIDHNHETGKVRGLLCTKCNLGLGHFNDDPKLLVIASKYLLKFNKQ